MKKALSIFLIVILIPTQCFAAYKINSGTGAWSAAATWDSVTNTPTLHASTNITISTSNYYSATFTAPNTTNACTGVLVYVSGSGATSSGTLTMTLQENSADVVGGGGTITVNGPLVTGWYYFRFTTSYVFTATTAGWYRFHVSRAGSWTSSPTFAADSGGSNFAYLATDDRTGVPAGTDDVFIVGQNGATAKTVTMDGTQTIGSGASAATPISSTRSILAGVMISRYGSLVWDTAASASLTCMGQFIVGYGGTWNMGTTTSAYPTGKIATLTMNQNGTTLNYGISLLDGLADVELCGEPKTSTTLWHTAYASGVGTAADPLIVSDSVNWAVNDEIMITASSDNATNYQETELRYIKTVNSATSYVLSTTVGGAEAALTYTHNTNARVVNLTRNVVITTNSSSQGTFLHNNNATNTTAFKWMRFNYPSYTSTAPSRYAFAVTNFTSTTVCPDFDYCVVYGGVATYSLMLYTCKTPKTFDGIVSVNNTGVGVYSSNSYNKTFTNFYSCKNTSSGIYSPFGNTFTNGYIISNDTAAVTTAGGVTVLGTSVFNNCEFHCNRYGALNTSSQSSSPTFNSCNFGTKGKNTCDIYVASDSVALGLWNNCSFGSDTFISNYLNGDATSLLRFHKYNTTAMNHRWYGAFGSAQATGAGLTDTNVRTPGSYAVRLTPEDSGTGVIWTFYIPERVGSIVSFFGWFQKNAAFGTDVAKVELWLDGSTSADDTFTLSNVTTWQACSISKATSATVDTLAQVKVYAKSATAGAYLYCDDFYNAGDTVTSTDKVTGLDTWYEGMPIEIIAPSSMSAADIWTFSTTALTTANTTGKVLVDAEKKADDAAILRGVN